VRSRCVFSTRDDNHLAEKAITATRNGLDVGRIERRISQDLPKATDAGVETVVELDDRSVGPDRSTQSFSRNHLAW
jgi:hypothetical protein